ncbi:MAG TPA: hypothetical protein VG738_24075 [Chitinophagaceae bacterium]|nr:hypothetical protein [Chitinophagaceae bacterium]
MKTLTPKLKKPALLFWVVSANLLTFNYLNAQYLVNNDSAFTAGKPNSGRLWGYAFGDFAYKGHSDSLSRGGKQQYTGIPAGRSTFQFRRIYLGYDYNISKKFFAELLLAMEDNFPAGNPPSSTSATGDLLSNGKIAPYIKYMNVRWKNIWKGTDLVIGQMSTPAFSLTVEKVWTYRSLERTITDFGGGTPSYDMGAALRGVFDPATKNYGYYLMVGNGNKAVPENDNFKWFYGDVWAKLLDKRIELHLYSDYERLNWTPTWHHDRNMIKGFAAYTTPQFTVGVEAFINNLHKDNFAVKKAGGVDTISVKAKGISIFARGILLPDKLRYVVRYDVFNPNTEIDNEMYSKYSSPTTGYNDPATKEYFILASLDWTPAKTVHIMPNIWYSHYASQIAGTTGKATGDHDIVYRLTFFYSFGM